MFDDSELTIQTNKTGAYNHYWLFPFFWELYFFNAFPVSCIELVIQMAFKMEVLFPVVGYFDKWIDVKSCHSKIDLSELGFF